MTLDDKVKEVMELDEVRSPFETYLGIRKGIDNILRSHSIVAVHNSKKISKENSSITASTLVKIAIEKRPLMDRYYDEFISNIGKYIDLGNVKEVSGYTEFDILEWDVEEFGDYELILKYRPKGADVSFWHKHPKDVKWD